MFCAPKDNPKEVLIPFDSTTTDMSRGLINAATGKKRIPAPIQVSEVVRGKEEEEVYRDDDEMRGER